MKPETIDAINAHALAQFPRESCGVVVMLHGEDERYIPCRNIAATAMEHVVWNPRDYADAEDMGKITCAVHSHPNVLPKPSMGDKVSCEASGIPWYIVSVYQDAGDAAPRINGSFYWEPDGFIAPLIGRSYTFGVLDCYTLIRDWFKTERGITLPDFERRDEFWNRGEELYLDNFKAAGFVEVPMDQPIEVGDVILLKLAIGNVQCNHAGVYIGNSRFLHHPYRKLSVPGIYGGYWREITRMIVRRNA